MTTQTQFDKATLAQIDAQQLVGIRAGRKPHRLLYIWMVVVDDRVFVRSWLVSPRSWYHTFKMEGVGMLYSNGREIPVLARPIQDNATNAVVNNAYQEKYRMSREVWDMISPRSIATTIELLPQKA